MKSQQRIIQVFLIEREFYIVLLLHGNKIDICYSKIFTIHENLRYHYIFMYVIAAQFEERVDTVRCGTIVLDSTCQLI